MPVLFITVAGCSGPLSTLEPGGSHAASVAALWWVMLAGAVVIFAGVMGAALFAIRPRRARSLSETRVLAGWGLVFPLLTLSALLVGSLIFGPRLVEAENPDMPVIEAVAERWRWTFRYPGGAVREELHVPAGERFEVRVTSIDVIHSFWVPRLGGKIDAIPGKVNRIHLVADEPGTYRGQCAEYCGVAHAFMGFSVHAHAPGDYAAVLADASADVPRLRSANGEDYSPSDVEGRTAAGGGR